jgi:hypothetical protein
MSEKEQNNMVLKTVNYVSSVVKDVGEIMNLGGHTISNICFVYVSQHIGM